MPAAPSSGNPLDALGRIQRLFADPGSLVRMGGRICEVSATGYRVRGISAGSRLGDVVEHRARSTARRGEIVRITSDDVTVIPFERSADAGVGDPVFNVGPFSLSPSEEWRGRAVNALGDAIDSGPRLVGGGAHAEDAPATPGALARDRVGQGFATGVKVIDIFTPICFGQRLGVSAGSGVGKSTLLAMLAAAEAFDTVVVALIGERGREVREFLEDTIGQSLAKTVTVVATSDESPMMRKRAPETAMRVAEHFRDRGHRVLVILDSVTRYAHALREVATAAGEAPVARGYPASVFTELPKLLERAGPGAAGTGSITAIISVLVDGDDHNDPVADCVRGILDGHIVLDRAIAEQGRYPPVNPLASISRLATKAWSEEQRLLVMRLKAMIARFEDTRDIRLLGAYQPGADAELDAAVRQVPVIYEALAQSPRDKPSADAFGDLARHLKSKERANAVAAA